MKLVCNEFNDFYINVGPSLSEKIPKQDILHINFTKYKAIYSLYLELVTEIEVKKLISSLKLATPGYDMISSSVLKWTLESISEPLCYICDMLYKKGYLPMKWKLQMLYPFTNAKTQNCLIIIAMYLFYVPHLRSLKKLCITDWMLIWIIFFFLPVWF